MRVVIKTLVSKYISSVVSIAILSALVWASVNYANFKKGEWEEDVRSKLLETLIGKKSNLEKALFSRIYYTRGVAAYVSLKPDITNDEYDKLANEYIKGDTVIGTMALSRNCIINAIYPAKGHEAAIGLNLLEHPERREIVQKTIQNHKTFVAGPVELIEGGVAFISYTPIFDVREGKNGAFWGVTDIVIMMEKLLGEAGLKKTDHDFQFALRGYNGEGATGKIFWGNPSVFDSQPVQVSIELPYGNWVLAGAPLHGWSHYINQDSALLTILIISSLIISFLILVILKAFQKIHRNERELKAVFRSLDSVVIEYNAKGEYQKIITTNNKLLYIPEKQLIGKTVFDVLDSTTAKTISDAITNCLESNKVVVIEYSLIINGIEAWFQARISKKSDSTVIFNAFDITNKKNDERTIRESEKRLISLNSLKDKLFSIIAHDLRNPVSNFRNMTELLVDNDQIQSPELKSKLIRSMHESAISILNLLENLLSWSKSQLEGFVVNQFDQSLKNIVDQIVDTCESICADRSISLTCSISETDSAYFDAEMTKTIVRNLLSNAIKYTPNGGAIAISAEQNFINNIEFTQIKIQDSGIGMNDSLLKQLLTIEIPESTPGLHNEKGTGLGLIICHEFAEKQGGKLEATSIPNMGSTFTLSLPTKKL